MIFDFRNEEREAPVARVSDRHAFFFFGKSGGGAETLATVREKARNPLHIS
jgi:hypothetical protein